MAAVTLYRVNPTITQQQRERQNAALTRKIKLLYFDVRVTHPNCESNMHKPLAQLYNDHETEKKKMYEERIIESEKGTFTPLVFSTSGGVGPLCKTFFQKTGAIDI